MPRQLFACVILAALALLAPSISAAAAPSAESLLPATTKGFVSIADVDLMMAKWNNTQIGQLMNDPVMKPFADDLVRQIENKFAQTGVRLGLNWDDLKNVYGGEVCMALIQPGNDKKLHAMAVLVDITGHHNQAQGLLEKISNNLAQRGGKKEIRTVGEHSVVVYTLPLEKGEIEVHRACYLMVKDQNLIISADHFDTLADIVQRLDGAKQNPLSGLSAFSEARKQLTSSAGTDTPHIHWFIEPFGYIEVSRAAAGGRRRRGTDLLKVLRHQGFSAIQGVGGFVSFSTENHEVLHHTFIHAPPVKRAADDTNSDRFNLAARMLNFPPSNGNSLRAQDWIPRNAASYLTFNWKMRDAFNYLETLVDELAGEEGTWEAVLEGLEKDPDGPQIKVKEEFIDHLAQRATLLTDYRLPITVTSERRMFAIELANVAAAKKTVDKAMSSDPKATKRVFGENQIIWEILNEEETEDISTELSIGVGGPGFAPFAVEEEQVAQGGVAKIPNMAVTVAHNHLIIASHVDFVVDMLKQADRRDNLNAAADYQLVNNTLDALGAGNDSLRSFSRIDEAFRPTYEMIRQGKMPQSESLMGTLLNRVLGSDEEGVTREQQIDGSKLPDYQVVRRYLGPAGLFVQPVHANNVEIGWLIVGCVLTKEAKDVVE